MEDLTLEQMNWEICQAKLTDAIKYLQECRERLEKALKNIGELGDENDNLLVQKASME